MAKVVEDLNLNEEAEADETLAFHQSNDGDTENFDRTIGLIEDLIMDDEFRTIQQEFLDKYAKEFDPKVDENKFIYTDIHREYLKIIEDFILNKIKQTQKDFSLDAFMKQLESHPDEFEGEIFEILLTFTDFLAFKQWMLDHRQENTVDLQTCLQSISLQSARGTNPTPLVPSGGSASANQPSSNASLDFGITGTKIKKPEDPKKKK